jgi:hypothetical protein
MLCIKTRKFRPLATTFVLSILALLRLTISLGLYYVASFLFLLVLCITDRLVLACGLVNIPFVSQHCIIADEGGGAYTISVSLCYTLAIHYLL